MSLTRPGGQEMKGLLKKTAISGGITALIYLFLLSFVDRPVDFWVHKHYANTWVFQLGTYISDAARGVYIRLGIALCFISILFCDPDLKREWTRDLLYICLSVSIAIILSDGLKYLLGRYRPIMLFEQNLYGFHFFSAEFALNSSPSGHTVRAFSLLTAASLLYRRFAVPFLSIAVLIGISRVAVTAHYPSDVLFGAYLGIFTAVWTFKHFFSRDDEGENISP